MNTKQPQQPEQKTISEKEFNERPFVAMPQTEEDAELKNLIIDYTGNKLKPEDGIVDVNMIVETMATEFPEFMYAFAEENFIRGYQTGLEDATKLPTKQTEVAESTEE